MSGNETGAPRAPIAFDVDAAEVTTRLATTTVDVDDPTFERLAGACTSVSVDVAERSEAGRDWWPLGMIWALDGTVAARAAVIARPGSADEVAAVLAICDTARIPVTAMAGRSGVCGASIPLHGGVALDLCGLSGIVDVDDTSLVADVAPGTFGTWLEDTLAERYGMTTGHWPQSIDLSTVGGWIACRGAGQLSTRYGKIEDMVVGLDVALADGRQITTGGNARAAVGPDLNQIFIGSEGTLGIITGARLRLHPTPVTDARAAYGWTDFAAGLDACRRILRRGATPAVLRLYDAIEGDRNFGTGKLHPLLVLDEGDPALVRATMAVVAEECPEAERLDQELVEVWLAHRNNVDALEALIRRGFVVDTMEITASWATCGRIYERAIEALRAVPHAVTASAHQSHAYSDGACLYFTFAGAPPAGEREAFYRAAWDAGTGAVLAEGGALSHHHGIGLNRARFVRDALGPAFDVLAATKTALDPSGILNPGKLGLDDPWAIGDTPAWS